MLISKKLSTFDLIEQARLTAHSYFNYAKHIVGDYSGSEASRTEIICALIAAMASDYHTSTLCRISDLTNDSIEELTSAVRAVDVNEITNVIAQALEQKS